MSTPATAAVASDRLRVLAPFERRLLTVLANEPLGAYRVLRASDPRGPRPEAGQFAMLAAAERWGGGEDERPLLPRAFSYARWLDGRSEVPQRAPNGVSSSDRRRSDRSSNGGEAHFLLEDVGPGTRRLCELQPGEGLWALGPLGVGFESPKDGRRPLLVGGGVGIAPLAIWQDELSAARSAASPPPKRRDHHPLVDGSERSSITVLLGFRDAAHAVGASLLRGAAVATDDGSIGHRGRVTDLLASALDRDDRVVVYACGPPPMLEAVRVICAERRVPAQLALESGMACGFGACFGCVVPTRSGYARLCVDGPVLDAAELQRVEHPGNHVLDDDRVPAPEPSP